MKKSHLSNTIKNMKPGILLLSGGCALGLYLSPTKLCILLLAVLFAMLAAVTLLKLYPETSNPLVRIEGTLLAGYAFLLGFRSFYTTWMPSSTVAALCERFCIPVPVLVCSAGLAAGVLGGYSLYTVSCWVFAWTARLLQFSLPTEDLRALCGNLKRNWYFPVSALAFFFLYAAGFPFGYSIVLLAAALAAAALTPSLFGLLRQIAAPYHAVAALNTLGISWTVRTVYYTPWIATPAAQKLRAVLPEGTDLLGLIGIVLTVCSAFFVYLCLACFWKTLVRLIRSSGAATGITRFEWVVYGLLLAASLAFMALCFAQSQAFYGTEHSFDIIYTSDSPYLVKGNVYLTLSHPENDLRQPLFAVFAAPFLGIPFLIGKLFGASGCMQAILTNAAQIVILYAANFLLAQTMQLPPKKRICFMLLTCSTYTQLLFTLMMEQYIIAYFWLMLGIYLIAATGRIHRMAMWGTAGTLLTSAVLLPFLSDRHPLRQFKAWFWDMVRYGVEFAAVMLAFCRFDILRSLSEKITTLQAFTGQSLTLADKARQYLAFVSGCFAAPPAHVDTTTFGYPSWQLEPATGLCSAGLVILLLAAVSAVWNRKKRICLLAAGWTAFSAVMLLGLGWGTRENGLILYALYFGWAFLVLLFQLADAIENRLNLRFFVVLLSLTCTALLAALNLPAIADMVRFAILHYPI